MRKLYSFFIYLLTPLALLHLALRGLRNRDYLKRWAERFGLFDTRPGKGGIVVHAASLGEVNAASPLIRELQDRFPDLPLSITTLSPTGSDRVRSLFSDSVFHVYVPLDLPGSVRRFFERTQPGLLLIMETEIWPNLYFEAARKGVPIVMANARISETSIGAYRRLGHFFGPTLRSVTRIAAQSARDAERLVGIGADPEAITVTGNLKFDVHIPSSLLEQAEPIRLAWGMDRLVLLAGSTHESDETAVLKAFKPMLAEFPAALLVIVPRHPERFGRSAQLARSAGLQVSFRSEGISCPRDTQCFIVDSMGELMLFYAACDVAFVGGSMERIGGHNVLEPAALGKPVIVGPHTFNFQDIARQLIDRHAALQIQDSSDLEQATRRLFNEPELRDRMGRAGIELVKSGQGALERTLEVIESVITRATG
ncbi:MAG: lipid IV(A) 3-deoxy-D-manno-octulosonic acid transferase [Xanthomonadales bacterium]|jgi:3-deoxy-D-manno-octulosonic-acid transferase|nr:lipid IV(A) 3-deoxy-D-manno-octulosonic acid transferase [Xanthomonadales bacterium]MDH4002246.1 lipid IV(A) 3-deoxy-D-manno-octulosonic acid transferase [Xanthomonadales bacterium]